MRVHDETDESQNDKWISFIPFQPQIKSSFRQLHEKFNRNGSIDYTSKTSVNDIEVIAQNTRQIIYSEIKDAGMFSSLFVPSEARSIQCPVNNIIKGSNLLLDIMSSINSLYTFLNHAKIARISFTSVLEQIDIRWGRKFEAVELITDKPRVILETLICYSKL
ncbi:unnamed protein product [Lepeophtheirus salmonis]|uniref:(salmon louse) hypothetical protein n=1 Tax=Lepeophtheirus salmonis TaxID=72036 RepID=A0A7R8CK38_LEPSM|nr:unnamed protein product [Lepeophtheirus salmonis]CAF2846134.1 unnamed protein product [Lepeophtheirus salmonis]